MPSLLRLWARILTCTVLLLKLNHVLTFPTESELSLHNTSKFLRAAQQALQRLHLCYFTAVLVTQALLPRKLPKPCTAERDCSLLEASSVPCPQQLYTKTAPGTLRKILLTNSQILYLILSLFSSPTFYPSESSSYLFWSHPSGDTLDAAVWSAGRTGQQYLNVFDSAVFSLKTLKTH